MFFAIRLSTVMHASFGLAPRPVPFRIVVRDGDGERTYDGRADISIQIGPVLRGAALRDATGIVRFTDFVNQLQFADVGNELNGRVLKTVLAPLDATKLRGRVVAFAGALAAPEGTAEPPLRELLPIRLTIEERSG